MGTSSKLHVLPLYVRDLWADTATLSLEEHGAYRLLLEFQWLNGAIPCHDIERARLWKVRTPKAKKLWSALVDYFPLGADGVRRNARLERERAEVLSKLSEASERGRAGAAARWGNEMPTASDKHSGGNASANAQAMLADSYTYPYPLAPSSSNPNPSPSPPAKDGEVDSALDGFDDFWSAYPKRPGQSKAAARRAWLARRRAGVTVEELLAGTERYRAYVEALGTAPTYIKHAATFLGPDEHYRADFTIPAAAPAKPLRERRERNLKAIHAWNDEAELPLDAAEEEGDE